LPRINSALTVGGKFPIGAACTGIGKKSAKTSATRTKPDMESEKSDKNADLERATQNPGNNIINSGKSLH
jgi:hypothetical protein